MRAYVRQAGRQAGREGGWVGGLGGGLRGCLFCTWERWGSNCRDPSVTTCALCSQFVQGSIPCVALASPLFGLCMRASRIPSAISSGIRATWKPEQLA